MNNTFQLLPNLRQVSWPNERIENNDCSCSICKKEFMKAESTYSKVQDDYFCTDCNSLILSFYLGLGLSEDEARELIALEKREF